MRGISFIKGVSSVSFFILLSRITGLFRDMSFAFFLGASYLTDALFIAWAIPNTLRRFFAEGLIAPAFVPAFSEAIKKGEIQKSFSSVLGVVIVITGGISLGLLLLSPLMPYVLSPGFPRDVKILTSEFIAFFSPYILLISIATVFSALLNSYRIFVLPASTMTFFNLSTIFGMLLLSHAPHVGFIIGVFLGVAVQVIFQLFAVLRKVRVNLIFRKNEYSSMVISALPSVIVGGAIYQINFLVSRAIASLGGENVISYLTYAMRFFELPLGVFVYSISFVALPSLAMGGEEREKSFSHSIFLSSIFSIPASFALFFLSEQIISIVFGYGKFTETDVRETARALSMYSLGLLPIALSRTLITDFQATRKLSIPVISGILNFIVNIFFCFLLVGSLRHVGIALSSSISALAGFFTLFYFSDRKKDIIREVGRAIFVSLIPSLSIYLFSLWFSHAKFSRVVKFLIISAFALLVLLQIIALSYVVSGKVKRKSGL